MEVVPGDSTTTILTVDPNSKVRVCTFFDHSDLPGALVFNKPRGQIDASGYVHEPIPGVKAGKGKNGHT